MIEVQLDALAEHCRNLIWEQLGPELELITCQQGCPAHVATPADLADAVPAVLLDPPKLVGGKPAADNGLPALEATVVIGVSFLRKIADDEEHPRATVQQLQRIAGLFASPDFKLEGWDDSEGLEVEEIYPADIEHTHDLTYEDSTVRLALGSIILQAKIIAYDPAG